MTIDLSLPKEKRIMLAAEEIFSKYGYDKATLDEIISLADVGKGTVYKYYGNKEQLFYKLVLEKNTSYVSALKEVVAQKQTLKEKICAYLEEMINFYQVNANLWRSIYFEMLGGHHGAMVCFENDKPVVKSVYVTEVAEETKVRMLRYHAILDDAFAIMRQLLSDASDIGVLKKSNDIIRTNYFLCGIAMVVFHDSDEINKLSVKEVAEICADRFLNGEKI